MELLKMTHYIVRSLICLVLSIGLTPSLYAKDISGPAADFTLKSTTKKNLRLKEYRGQIVLLNFLASWCGPCRQEMPILNNLHKQYEALGFTVLGVSLDEDPGETDKLLKAIPVDFPVLYGGKSDITDRYEINAMPTTIIIDRDGNQRFLHLGFKAGYELKYEEQIKNLIRE